MTMERKRKILVAEDDEDDRFFLLEAAARAAIIIPIETAADGEEALAKIIAVPPLLVLLDLKLPKVSGLEVLRGIRRHPRSRRTPVLVLTASSEPADIDGAYELGANAYLCKPASLADLVLLMESIKRFWIEKNLFPGAPVDARPRR